MPRVVLFDLSFHPSLGLKAIEARLRQLGIGCEIINFSREFHGMKRRFQNYKELDNATKKAIVSAKNKIMKIKPELQGADFFGISFFATSNEIGLRSEVARFLKKEFPGKILVGGGPGISSDPKRFLSYARLDYAIMGDAENALPQLIEALAKKTNRGLEKIDGLVYRKGGKIVVSPNFAFLSRDEVKKLNFVSAKDTKEYIATYTEKGCSFACVFCSVPRKGKPAALDEDTIINGLLKLSGNKKIRGVDFVDDQLFFDRERSKRILSRIIETGLAKRFSFRGLATIDSLLLNGAPDIELIKLIKAANFYGLQIGTESLNDNILKEIKSARYIAIQAIKVDNELKKAGIKAKNFMIAGSIETRAIDFLESYYRAMARNVRHGKDYMQPVFITAERGTPIYKTALKEGMLFSIRGKHVVEPEKQRKPAEYSVFPKDEKLGVLFKAVAKKGGWRFEYDKAPALLKFSRSLEAENPEAKKLSRGIAKVYGQEETKHKTVGNIAFDFFNPAMLKELKKRGMENTIKNTEKLFSDKRLVDRELKKAVQKAREYVKATEAHEKLLGPERIRQAAKIRRRFGLFPTSGVVQTRRLKRIWR